MQEREELELFQRRIRFIGYVVVAALVVLLAGFWNHQIARSTYYAGRAEQNRVRDIPLVAPRGRIYDRYNRLLADSRPSYDILLIREDSPHTVEQTASMLGPGIDVQPKDLLERIYRRQLEPKFRPIVLKEDISAADIAFVKSHRYELPEISAEIQPRRRYMEAGLAAHVLGYVGEVTEAQLAMEEFEGFGSGDQVGQSGLERQYNRLLRGTDGIRRVVVNSSGREMDQLFEQPPIPGNDLHTTLDLDLQRIAEEMVGDRTGAVVAIDPTSGEVLALVSKPAYDPNLFATRLSPADWNGLINDPRKPLQNRAIQNHYSPGSVFKVFMAAAGLESGALEPRATAFCNGGASFYGRTFACWKRGGHGRIGLHEAIASSCNVFFYHVGRNLGIDRIAHYATTMGLGRKTGIDLPNEATGLIPSSAWKQQVFNTAWYPGETISVAIGQGAVSITPMQLAWAIGGFASGGRLVTPHLIRTESMNAVGFEPGELRIEEYDIRQSTIDVISRAMWGAVNEAGTGTRAHVEGFDVAGKTGTAQVVRRQLSGESEQFEDHAWFAGFAPYRNPQLVVAVFIENGGGGGAAAAPVAHAVFEAFYRKKGRPLEDGQITSVAGLGP